SLIEPPGLWLSSLKYSSQGPASRRCALTMGVWAISSRTEAWIVMRAAGWQGIGDYRIRTPEGLAGAAQSAGDGNRRGWPPPPATGELSGRGYRRSGSGGPWRRVSRASSATT